MGHKHAYTNATKAYNILYSSKVCSYPTSVGKGPVSEVALIALSACSKKTRKKGERTI